MASTDFTKLKKEELKEECKKRGLKGYSTKNKDDLVNLLVTTTTAPTTPTPSSPSPLLKPAMKWVGGKSQILDAVLDTFPPSMNNYYEPFVGGGSVLLGLLSHIQSGKITVKGTVYASDLNANLIHLYQNIQSRVEALIAELEKLAASYTPLPRASEPPNRAPASLTEAQANQESFYYWMRAQFNKLTAAERAEPRASALLLFLNKTCFRGVYREGPHGFNVPFDKTYKNPAIYDAAHLRALSAAFAHVVFMVAPFQTALAPVAAGDFVYLDPPYAPESETSFVSYTADGFTKEAHEALFKHAKELVAAGASFTMSNANVKMVRDAFPPTEFNTTVIDARRAINSKNPESMTKEVLVVPAPPATLTHL